VNFRSELFFFSSSSQKILNYFIFPFIVLQEPVPPKVESPVKIFEPQKIEIDQIFEVTKTEEPARTSLPESPFKVPKAPANKKNTGLKPEPTRGESDSDDETPNQNISLSIGCPSPKLTPYKQSSSEKDLLDWSKKSLASYSQIKITNLSSSWRNGLGFCALIFESYPELIPMKSLKTQNRKDNCELAFQSAKLVGVETSLVVEDLTDSSVPDKSAVMAFLRELRLVLSQPDRVVVDGQVVTDYQKNWFRKSGYFAKEVEDLVRAEDEAVKAAADEEQKQKQMEAEHKEIEEEEPQGEDREEEERRPVRDRVREMIATAHREASFDANDVMTSGRVLRESKTISEEMSKLAMEEDR
jgi:Calponin homology (CH) domain